MDHSESSRRAVANSQFRDYANILQGNVYGDVHYHPSLHQPAGHLSAHPPTQPSTQTQAQAQATVRIIPYPRNEDIVHRQDLVDQLNKLLPQTERHCSAALWGLGGSGKTQIALDYAYRRSDDDTCSVFWVHADSEATFVHDYQAIAQELGIDRSLDTEALLVAVCRRIETQPKWALIIDNADDLRLFGVGQTPGQTSGQTTNLYKYVPRGTVLWTSRDERIVGTLIGARRGIPVARMTSIEAQNLLHVTRNAQTSNEEDEIATLLEELQWLPLAVSQAGAYMRRTRTSVKDYLFLLAESRYNLLGVTENDRHRRPNVTNNILDTWNISIHRLEYENKRAYRILHVIAYLDNQNIGEEILTAAGRYSEVGFVEEPEYSAITEAVTRLRELSFISLCVMHDDNRIYEMHKLVQEAARYGLSLKKSTAVTEGDDTGAHNLANTSEAFFSGIALQVMSNLFPESTPHTREVCEKYLAHAVRVAEWAELSAKQVETASLVHAVSDFLFFQGRWREKEPKTPDCGTFGGKHLGNCTQIRLAPWQASHRHAIYGADLLKLNRCLFSMIRLAGVYYKLLRCDEAADLYFEAWDLSRHILGDRHEQTIRALEGCADLYTSQGQYYKAETMYINMLNLSREVRGEEDPGTIFVMRALAHTYQAQKRHSEAHRILVKALDLCLKVLGEKHPDTSHTMQSLGISRYYLGYQKDALSLVQQCWNLQNSTLGSDHVLTKRSAEILKEWTSRECLTES
ncbi:P-loop containing nucleoside triphosphate hydrolase protein [Dactylonectria macrodidyma]|uniref:P-loop containing nucleoside triphosphate hydrolase protein n=1 Tax=Dactylonectria macrodidyma TaxID=307937 RepID=A0A9P9ING6_9HYPO|nr:P-loop containing nucleoside triphosphate hydrolase protein [Dactylonectria macrodidyma]